MKEKGNLEGSTKDCLKYSNKNSGITLIALVVTIVVLIVLATVSINAVFGQNGIIKKAQQAKEMYEQSVTNEDTAMQELLNELAVDREDKEDDTSDPTKDWDLNKVDKVTSEDNIIVPVPKGYTASTVEGEKSVSSGFVIKEGNDGSKTEGINEFVWVPVSNISDIYDEANNAGQLWDFSGTTSKKITYTTNQNYYFREPDVVTNANSGSDSTSGSKYDAVSSNLQQAGMPSTATASTFKTQLQNEFKEMIKSVKTYGGFFIGRYETGNLSQTKAVVQKNNTNIDNQTWYTMYKVCKTIKANDNVATSMLWGCQWDATLRWMQTSTNSEVANFPTNSTGKGNYEDTNGNAPIPTGSNNSYSVNNIYDMAGNVFDWTLEARDTDSRVGRGGNYYATASDYPASGRYYGIPTSGSSIDGCRSTLYVK